MNTPEHAAAGGNIKFFTGDLSKFAFPPASFDAGVLCVVCCVLCVVCYVWCVVCASVILRACHESARCRVGACAFATCVARLRERASAKEGAKKLLAIRCLRETTRCYPLLARDNAMCRGRAAALRPQFPLSIHAHTRSKKTSTGAYVHTTPFSRSVSLAHLRALLALWY